MPRPPRVTSWPPNHEVTCDIPVGTQPTSCTATPTGTGLTDIDHRLPPVNNSGTLLATFDDHVRHMDTSTSSGTVTPTGTVLNHSDHMPSPVTVSGTLPLTSQQRRPVQQACATLTADQLGLFDVARHRHTRAAHRSLYRPRRLPRCHCPLADVLFWPKSMIPKPALRKLLSPSAGAHTPCQLAFMEALPRASAGQRWLATTRPAAESMLQEYVCHRVTSIVVAVFLK